MKISLIKSFFFLTIFYYSLFLVGWFIAQGVGIFEIGKKLDTLYVWTLPMLLAPLGVWILAFFVSYLGKIILVRKRRKTRVAADSSLGVNISLGKIPRPVWSVKKDKVVGLQITGELGNILDSLPTEHRLLFNEVANVLYSNPEAFVGPGHTESLLEHSLNVLQEASAQGLSTFKKDPLAVVAVLAHDLGKIHSHEKKDSGEWVKVGTKEHDVLTGMIVSSLDSFRGLDYRDAQVLTLVLKYTHKPWAVPWIDGDGGEELNKRVSDILDVVKKADKIATSNEKKKIVKEIDKDELFKQHFFNALNKLNWHHPGAKKGGKMSAWRNGNHVFVAEIALRDALIEELPKDWQSAFNKGRRQRGEVAEITQYLVDWLKRKKWLVNSFNEMSSDFGLWNIKAGTASINGVFYLKVSEDVVYDLPPSATYSVEIISAVVRNRARKRAEAINKKVTREVIDEFSKGGSKKGAEASKPEKDSKSPDDQHKKSGPEDKSLKKTSQEQKPSQASSKPAGGGDKKGSSDPGNNRRRKPRDKRSSQPKETYISEKEAADQKRLLDMLKNPFQHSDEEVAKAEEELSSLSRPYLYSEAWAELCKQSYELEIQNPYFLAMNPNITPSRKKRKRSAEDRNRAIQMAILGTS